MKWPNFRNVELLPVVGDGLLSSPSVGEGRLIPHLILHAPNRPDIGDLFRVHAHLPPGDVISQWGETLFSRRWVALHLTFKSPLPCEFGIKFDIQKHVAVVDGVMHAQATYLQLGVPGDKLSNSMGANRILVEIPRSDYFKKWDRRAHDEMFRRMRNNGLPRAEATKAAAKMMATAREMWRFRQV